MRRRGAFGLVVALGLLACSRDPLGRAPARTALRAPEKPTAAARRQVKLAANGHAFVSIVAPPPRPQSATPKEPKPAPALRADALRLERSVADLALYLSRMASDDIPIVRSLAEVPSAHVPILIGELGQQRFGPVGAHALGNQAFRFVVDETALGLYGESDLATSYAIYELLDRLGCRWFMPGELGEEIPRPAALLLATTSETLAPATLYRGLWYADEDFKRRNRFGGVQVAAGHMLEKWVSREQREAHPEWRARIGGQAAGQRLRWSEPAVASAIAQAIDERLERKPASSVSLSPMDGSDFDEGDDRALDAGDFDPTTNQVSLTDRLLVLTNRVALELAPKYPDLTFGLLAYASYTRPPVRETVHPRIVPVIAPISYCRAQPWSDDACPGARDLRDIVRGWAARSERLAFRGYVFNLAEPAAPNPMMRKSAWDLPFLFANKVRFYQPETLPNFETSLPALYLATRLSWNNALEADAVLGELFERFYGDAGQAVHGYLDLIDRAWATTPVYAGGALGYAKRFSPQLMIAARAAMDAALRACRTDRQRQRVAMLEESLAQLERHLAIEAQLRAGALDSVAAGMSGWLETAERLADRYADNSAFGRTRWAKGSAYAVYMKRFLEPLVAEADRIARGEVLLAPKPVCSGRFRFVPELSLPMSAAPIGLDDGTPSTDFCSDTWSALGKHDYFGGAVYQAEVELAAVPAGKRVRLWLSRVDGIVQVWLNGKVAQPVGAGPTGPATGEAQLKALTFDVTAAQTTGRNQLVVAVKRTRLVELGAGGLLGPAYFYRDP